MMEAPQLLALQFTLSLLAYGALGFWVVRPWLLTKPRATALAILVFPQTFRFVGVTLLVPGVVEPGLPEAFARPTAIGDTVTTVLAWLTLIALRAGSRFAVPAVWVFNLVGLGDLLLNLIRGVRLHVASQLGAAWFGPAFIVPAMLVSHVLIFFFLPRGNASAASPPAARAGGHGSIRAVRNDWLAAAASEPQTLPADLESVMKTKRKIIVYIATSADGYIARPDGDVEWLNRRPRNVDYGMKEFYPTIDTILWGRKTYDWLLNYYKQRGKTKGLFDTKLANYVFSRKPPKRPAPGVQFVSEPVKAFAKRLRATPGKQIWMMGGGELIASFLDAGEIDEFDIHVMPVFIGKGIPLVAPRHRDVPLRLLSSRKYPDGVVRVHYEVAR